MSAVVDDPLVEEVGSGLKALSVYDRIERQSQRSHSAISEEKGPEVENDPIIVQMEVKSVSESISEDFEAQPSNRQNLQG